MAIVQRDLAELAERLGDAVSTWTLSTSTLPLFVAPKVEQPLEVNLEWLASHRDAIDVALRGFGSLLFRNFGLKTSADLKLALSDRQIYGRSYAAGQAPRSAVDDYVFDATASPADRLIRLHQEMAYLPHQPPRIAFFSELPAASGGETIIADMRLFTRRAPNAFLDRLEERGVLYRSNFMDRESLVGFQQVVGGWHKSWQDAFSTDDPRQAERSCENLGLNWAWRPDGSLDTWHRAPAFKAHPETGERVWFNMVATQVHSHASLCSRETYGRYLKTYGPDRPPPFEARYGDDEPINPEDVIQLYPLYEELTVAFPWQQGDLLLVDNHFTAHGRNPYTGERATRVVLLN